MFEITFKANKSHIKELLHAEIKVRCMQTGKCFVVSFGSEYAFPATDNAHKISKFTEEEKFIEECEAKSPNDCWWNAVKLYSNIDKSFDEVFKEFNTKFSHTCGSCCCCGKFNLICNNCSDACNFTFNYFFSNRVKEMALQTYKCATLPCYIATCGKTSFFSALPCINTPQDMLKKADQLSKTYGEPPLLSDSKPMYQSMV